MIVLLGRAGRERFDKGCELREAVVVANKLCLKGAKRVTHATGIRSRRTSLDDGHALIPVLNKKGPVDMTGPCSAKICGCYSC